MSHSRKDYRAIAQIFADNQPPNDTDEDAVMWFALRNGIADYFHETGGLDRNGNRRFDIDRFNMATGISLREPAPEMAEEWDVPEPETTRVFEIWPGTENPGHYGKAVTVDRVPGIVFRVFEYDMADDTYRVVAIGDDFSWWVDRDDMASFDELVCECGQIGCGATIR